MAPEFTVRYKFSLFLDPIRVSILIQSIRWFHRRTRESESQEHGNPLRRIKESHERASIFYRGRLRLLNNERGKPVVTIMLPSSLSPWSSSLSTSTSPSFSLRSANPRRAYPGRATSTNVPFSRRYSRTISIETINGCPRKKSSKYQNAIFIDRNLHTALQSHTTHRYVHAHIVTHILLNAIDRTNLTVDR